jgi:hypothetical protein
MIAPLLRHVDLSKPFVLEIDTFGFTLGVVLSQPWDDDLLHHVNFCSCELFPIEINYEIHDKKIMAIVNAFEEWRHLLQRIQHEIIVYFDHKNL